jgi:hypothetical protein
VSAQASILFDAHAGHHLPVGGLALLGSVLTGRLLADALPRGEAWTRRGSRRSRSAPRKSPAPWALRSLQTAKGDCGRRRPRRHTMPRGGLRSGETTLNHLAERRAALPAARSPSLCSGCYRSVSGGVRPRWGPTPQSLAMLGTLSKRASHRLGRRFHRLGALRLGGRG